MGILLAAFAVAVLIGLGSSFHWCGAFEKVGDELAKGDSVEGVIVECAVPTPMRVVIELERQSDIARGPADDDLLDERARRCEHHDFFLRTRDGELIEVHTSASTVLLFPLERGRDEAVGVATARLGDDVVAAGRMASAPDPNGEITDLREPPRSRRVLVCSHLAPSAVAPLYRTRAWWYASFALVYVMIGLAGGWWVLTGHLESFASVWGTFAAWSLLVIYFKHRVTSQPWYWQKKVRLRVPCATPRQF